MKRKIAPSDGVVERHKARHIARRLCRWFDEHARDLPWRHNRSGYSALVSEAMLQQTQVARVIDVFQRFMRRFPTVAALAAADEQDVLALWQGMGYYRRARNLHTAARMIVSEFAGSVPDSVSDLLRLPGVGRYTAGAIASILHGKREPIVDGNVQRVLARWHAHRSSRDPASDVAWTWDRAAALVQAAALPGVFNEAMMELGAMICTPSSPRCTTCPVATLCLARQQGVQDQIPSPRARAATRAVVHHAVVFTRNRGGRVLIEQRPATGMWAGMWQVPTLEAAVEMSPSQLRSRLPISVASLQRVGHFQHQTTHRSVTFAVYQGTTRSRTGVWVDRAGIAGIPLGNAQRRILQMTGVLPNPAGRLTRKPV